MVTDIELHPKKTHHHCVSARQSRDRFLVDTVLIGYTLDEIGTMIQRMDLVKSIAQDSHNPDRIVVHWNSLMEYMPDHYSAIHIPKVKSTTIPVTYWRHSVDPDGVFERLKDRVRVIDHVCGTWYYGHDKMNEGGCWAWMRPREKEDRSHNDIHRMVIVNGIWEMQA
jgi:hypothetical protein